MDNNISFNDNLNKIGFGGGSSSGENSPHRHNRSPLKHTSTSSTTAEPYTKLKYSIHSWSSHSCCFYPENILLDNPNDQSSRWSTGNNNLTQFILLELEQVSVVQTITFGKYNEVHVCNLKEFKVYGGLTPNDMVELLHNGLRNNHHPETFSLKFSFKNVLFPCKYIKIVPLLAWGTNFNCSIWYVELQGNCEPSTTEQVYKQYAEYRD